ncbi:MAG: hypothetical protein EBT98_01275 [Opitutaceae bacterium]|nr:hypothetical protein [Opitutaceae bacterium]
MIGPEAQRARAQLKFWWLAWVFVGVSLLTIYSSFSQPPSVVRSSGSHPLTGLTGLLPLFLSIIIRWLVLPRCTHLKAALPWFIVGLALAEAAGLLGALLGGVYRANLCLLGLLGFLQYAPTFARQYLDPKPTGYIPNN